MRSIWASSKTGSAALRRPCTAGMVSWWRRSRVTRSPGERGRNVITREQALAYHSEGRPGKLKISPTKPTQTQRDLSLAYTPGVAEPCREIARLPEEVFRYTARGNLVAVVTNGTAVLGLGNLGPLAAKPVMEGKAVLFKRFADIDVIGIENDRQNIYETVRTVQLIAPTFGGINLQDFRPPQ